MQRRRALTRWLTAAAALTGTLAITATPALAAPGDVDLSYGHQGTYGLVVRDHPALDYLTQGAEIGTGANGAVFVGGLSQAFSSVPLHYVPTLPGVPNQLTVGQSTENFFVGRLGTDDRIDRTYGMNGFAQCCFTDPKTNLSAARLVPQPDGKVLLGLGSELVRFTQNGTLDPTFGTGGRVGGLGYVGGLDYASPALQPDGKIVLVNDEIKRLLANGELDTSYGTSGYAILPTLPGRTVQAMSPPFVDRSGRLLVGLTASCSTVPDPSCQPIERDFLARFTPDGVLDTSFANGGLLEGTFPQAPDLQQPDGAYIITTTDAHERFLAVRVTPDGTLDSTFKAAVFGRAAIAEPDGKLVIVSATPDRQSWALVRLLPNGSLDTSFGKGGYAAIAIARPSLPPPFYSYDQGLFGVVRTPDGKLLAALNYSSELALAGQQGTPDTPYIPPDLQREEVLLIRFFDDGRPQSCVNATLAPVVCRLPGPLSGFGG